MIISKYSKKFTYLKEDLFIFIDLHSSGWYVLLIEDYKLFHVL